MSFEVATALRRSTGRAKSDVANKLVSMFQQPYQEFVRWSAMVRGTLREKIEILYRDCQRFATDEIGKLVAEVNLEFAKSDILTPED